MQLPLTESMEYGLKQKCKTDNHTPNVCEDVFQEE